MKRVMILVILIGMAFILTSCGCNDTYAPVCSVDKVTYKNACMAEQNGAEVDHEGACIKDETPAAPETVIVGEVSEGNCSQQDASEKTYCLEQKAKAKTDISYCNQIENPDQQNLCLAKVSQDSQYCYRVWHPGLRDACLLDFALLNSNVDLCLKIQELMNRYGCVDRISENTFNKTVCEYIDKGVKIGPKDFYNDCMRRNITQGFELIDDNISVTI